MYNIHQGVCRVEYIQKSHRQCIAKKDRQFSSVQHSRGKGWDSWGRHLPTKGKPGFTSTREGKLKKKNENKEEMYFEIRHSKLVLEEYIH